MLSNDDFVKILEDSFHKYIETSARSNEKLKILHGAISTDLKERLNSEYSISSLGIGNGKEELVLGRYIDKRVDITIKRNDKPIAGVAVKFVMSNYSQNSNNYFENMLGETANIRCSDIAYFQVFILLQNMPYFENGGRISKWEQVNKNNLGKYLKLSEDNISDYYHTPTKTLIMMVKNRQISSQINDREAYIKFYENRDNIVFDITKDKYSFGDSIIFQDYKLFMDKICHYIEFI